MSRGASMDRHAGPSRAAGFVAAGFDPIADAFAERLAVKHGGAALSIRVAGRSVVRLHGGSRSAGEGPDDWSDDTLVNLFSVSKTLFVLCVLLLVDRGRIALDDPVCLHWPEFAANGKEAITVRQVLSHTAGLPGVSERLESADIFDRARICRCLEQESPWWPPGTRRGVHTQFYCHLIGEIVRRVTGESIATLWRRDLAPALGATDAFMGVPDREHSRIAHCVPFTPAEKAAYLSDPDSLLYRVMTNPPVTFDDGILNSPLCWSTETCVYGTAESVARAFDVLARVRSGEEGPISPRLLTEALTVQTEGFDEVLGRPKRWCLGLQAFGATGWIGMGGIGGTLAAVHPEAEASFAFLPNAMGDWRHALVLLNVLSPLVGAPPL